LGRGAQSVVYLGFDPQLQREVAIKTLHFAHPDPAKNQALLAEARAVGRMRHPNIVPIYEAGEEVAILYLVFEYVPGKNLADFSGRAAPCHRQGGHHAAGHSRCRRPCPRAGHHPSRPETVEHPAR
jgi:serine/threonine protein kinase